MAAVPPVLAALDSQALVDGTTLPAGVSLRRLFTKRDHNSDMTVGVYEMAPGEASKWWSTEQQKWEAEGVFNVGEVDEFLFTLSGVCTIETPDGSFDCPERTAAFIPRGGRFRMINSGRVPTQVLYGLTPAMI